jgi:Tfp pilus assembly protein PilX
MDGKALQRRKSLQRAKRRSGYLYVAVLFTTLIISAVVTASLTVSTSNARSSADRSNRKSALRLAESELHRVAARLSDQSSWRTDHTSGQWTTWIAIDSGFVAASSLSMTSDDSAAAVRYRLTEADDDLRDDLRDQTVLTAHARVGQSQAAVSVTLQPSYPPLPILNYGLTATDDLELEDDGTLSSDGIVQVVDDCKTNTSGVLISPQLECSGSVQFNVRGSIAAANVTLPSHNVVDVYAENATTIAIGALSSSAGERQMQDVVLTSQNNPFGTPDPLGVYKIDAQGSVIRISHCRIDATLVIQNCPRVEVAGGITWSFPNQADAILVTDGLIRFDNLDSALDESSRGTNFNPPSSPYRLIDSNNNQSDTFPTELRGIIYAVDDIEFEPLSDNSRLLITGAVIGSDVRVSGDVSITRLTELIDTPPVAFADWEPLQFQRGSFRRVETP